MPHPLDDMLTRLQRADLLCETRGDVARQAIQHLVSDSRKVAPNDLFVAIRGHTSDGHHHIPDALKQGATAIVAEALAEPSDAAVFARVSSSRAAWAELSAQWFDDPSHPLNMIGITGTNGKTTTAFLVHHLLTRLGKTCGLMGTIAYRIGRQALDAPHTTPDAYTLNEILHRMMREECGACVMEVSSHALDQRRVHAIDYDVGVFTNLTRDHLDYHATFEDYRAAKKRLFDGLKDGDIAVFNADDASGAGMVADTTAQPLSYGRSPAADIQFEIQQSGIEGLQLRIDGAEHAFRLVGDFNAYNLTAAYSVGRALGYAQQDVLRALASAPPVPGRFEQFHFDSGVTVVVDYAHTPDALENVLQTMRGLLPEGRALWCIFGCGGDRDRPKRRTMGRIAEHVADHVVVTTDNPRTEDPQSIMNDIRRGMQRPLDVAWIVDRQDAIAYVAAHAAPRDVVLLAGKGHETYQIVGTEKQPFDDREAAKEAFGT